MIKTLLIANRGEIACRIIKTAQKMGIQTVAIYSDADEHAVHVRMADRAISIGAAEASASYLNSAAILEAARRSGVDAIHPGYGFLSENPDFAEACEKAGLRFIGPPANTIRQMGRKDSARQLMASADIPVVPGYDGQDQSDDCLSAEADKIGYPVLIKARSGGGGKGMRLVQEKADFKAQLEAARREATASFGDDKVILEKYITAPRHIEVQIFSDSFGNHLHLFERDCSLQRRYQKVIEEAPAPDMPEAVRTAMTKAAVMAAKSINYVGAGTIEFIADGKDGLREDGFWFMEMNTRLQVEHPVTEAVTGIDLVEWQLRIAADEALPLKQDALTICGHAIEARLYAEDARHDFRPCPGPITTLLFAEDTNIRVDTGVESGGQVSRFYDPMIAKIISFGQSREEALSALQANLSRTHLLGTQSNLSFLARLCENKEVRAGKVDTHLIDAKLDDLSAEPQATPLALFVACLSLTNLTQTFAGWRHFDEGQTPFKLRGRDEAVYDCVFAVFTRSGKDNYRLYHGEKAIEVDSLRQDRRDECSIWHFVYENTPYRAESVRAGNNVSLSFKGQNWQFDALDFIPAEAKITSKNVLTAPMTATVTAINVENGEQVSEGQSLIRIEAMKMEQNLTAPQDGVVDDILVEAGQGVNEGDILLRFRKK